MAALNYAVLMHPNASGHTGYFKPWFGAIILLFYYSFWRRGYPRPPWRPLGPPCAPMTPALFHNLKGTPPLLHLFWPPQFFLIRIFWIGLDPHQGQRGGPISDSEKFLEKNFHFNPLFASIPPLSHLLHPTTWGITFGIYLPGFQSNAKKSLPLCWTPQL